MSDQPENIMLVYVRRLDEKMDRIIEDVGLLKIRMTHVEEGLAVVNRRLDRVDQRLDRIERRLDLAETPAR
jgi:hypothetical protein